MRVVAALWWDRHRGMEQVDDLLAMREGTGERERLHAGTVKIMLDGCPESCTAAMRSPYDGRFGDAYGRGIAFVEDELLQRVVVALDAEGFQVHQHALGDRAVTMALDALQGARHANGPNGARHHIAHIQTPDPADVPRLRALGVVANLQPLWACYDDTVAQITVPRVGEERFHRMYPLADIRASGAVIAFGSDWPVSTPNVFEELEVAVTRVPPWARETPVWSPAQRIDLPAAIAAFTRGSAYVNHDDDGGSLELGKRADLVVVDRNLFDPSQGPIGDAKAVMTVASGRVVHRAAEA
jgi:predicted amidohydrolase YtcJ